MNQTEDQKYHYTRDITCNITVSSGCFQEGCRQTCIDLSIRQLGVYIPGQQRFLLIRNDFLYPLRCNNFLFSYSAFCIFLVNFIYLFYLAEPVWVCPVVLNWNWILNTAATTGYSVIQWQLMAVRGLFPFAIKRDNLFSPKNTSS